MQVGSVGMSQGCEVWFLASDGGVGESESVVCGTTTVHWVAAGHCSARLVSSSSSQYARLVHSPGLVQRRTSRQLSTQKVHKSGSCKALRGSTYSLCISRAGLPAAPPSRVSSRAWISMDLRCVVLELGLLCSFCQRWSRWLTPAALHCNMGPLSQCGQARVYSHAALPYDVDMCTKHTAQERDLVWMETTDRQLHSCSDGREWAGKGHQPRVPGKAE
jgi:hypothetical protein